MSLDFSTLILLFFVFMTLQPMLTGRWYSVQPVQKSGVEFLPIDIPRQPRIR